MRSTTAIGFGCLLNAMPASAQQPADISDIIGGQAQQKIEERLKWAYQQEEQNREKIGRKAAELIKREGRKRTINIGGKSFPQSPAEHPLLANDGADPAGKSEDQYTKEDTKIIFHDETFAQCLEDRQVFNQDYLESCSKKMPWAFCKNATRLSNAVHSLSRSPLCAK